MKSRKLVVLALWIGAILVATLIAVRAHYVTDLSAFLPRNPTRAQRLLIDQLREGPASRTILAALEGGEPVTRARLSVAMAARLRRDPEFSRVDNGERPEAQRDEEFLFQHRYLLSEAVNEQRFSVDGLHHALEETISRLSSPEGLLLKSLVPHDPTGEMLQLIDQLSRTEGPLTRDGVWVSADAKRTLLVARTAAEGSDTDAQEHALTAIRSAFEAATHDPTIAGASTVELRMSGPGVFAVAARAKIKNAAIRLSMVSSALIIVLLLCVYRSPAALMLGLLPVLTGALAGVAAVALGFGMVHGITLGFGVTLIGESVDYSIYFFVQSSAHGPTAAGPAAWRQRVWPIVRLGMLTSVCGFASLLPSGFPGLAQLGAYSICGLLAAAAVTRFVLPELVPGGFRIRDLTPFGQRIEALLATANRLPAAGLWIVMGIAAAVALVALFERRGEVWNRELSSLSPIPLAQLEYDAKLRGDLGAANVLDLVIVSGDSLESVLRGAEKASRALEPLVQAKVIGGVDSPANYLPSLATQEARRASLPDAPMLRENLARGADGLSLEAGSLSAFLTDVETARHGPLLAPDDLRHTSLAAGFDALIEHGSTGWTALLPLRAADPQRPDILLAPLQSALNDAQISGVQILDMKRESDALYAGYLREATVLSLTGLAIIVALLWVTLRSAARVALVILPLLFAVLAVASVLAASGVHLTILHLVGMLLIVAVGSNYALFFDAQRHRSGEDATPLTLASLVIANVSTVLAFGLLCFSQVPVLEALGSTVAPGTFLSLLFAALLMSRRPRAAIA